MTNNKIADLILLIALEDDRQAFGVFFKHYFRGLVSYGSSIVKNHQAVEDLVTDVFVKIWENRKMLLGIHNISNYMYVATKHACLNYCKSKRNEPHENIGETLLYAESNPESTLVNTENVNGIISLINSLPPRCRLIFKLIKDEDMSYAEVADLLDISIRTVNAQMTIAIAKIIEGLKLSMPELNQYYLKKNSTYKQ